MLYIEETDIVCKNVLNIILKYLKCQTGKCTNRALPKKYHVIMNMWDRHHGMYCYDCYKSILCSRGYYCGERSQQYQG